MGGHAEEKAMKRFALLISSVVAAPAFAGEILSFGQSGAGTSPITGVASGGVTTITAIDAPISVTSCLSCLSLIGSEFLTLHAVSVGPATLFSGFVVQGFSGTFDITTSGGQDVLSGTFTDATFGAGTSLTLSASNNTKGESLILTSGVMPLANTTGAEAASLSFAGVTPAVGVSGGTLSSFKASVAGTFSGGQAVGVPEPSSLALLLMGLSTYATAAVVRFRRRRE